MGIHTTDAIILRQYPYRETSVLVTCLTDRFGKLKGIVKGLRAPQTRYRSAMEPLTLNRLVFYETRTSSLHLISQCELLNGFTHLHTELAVMRAAASCAELADAVVEGGDAQPHIFHLLHDTLTRLGHEASQNPTLTRMHFALRLLRLAGFQPQLIECVGCSKAVPQGWWSVRQGGVLCEACLHEDPHAEPIASTLLETLATLAEAEAPSPLHPDQVRNIQRRVDEFLRWHLDRPLKTLKMTNDESRMTNDKRSQFDIRHSTFDISR